MTISKTGIYNKYWHIKFHIKCVETFFHCKNNALLNLLVHSHLKLFCGETALIVSEYLYLEKRLNKKYSILSSRSSCWEAFVENKIIKKYILLFFNYSIFSPYLKTVTGDLREICQQSISVIITSVRYCQNM